MESERCMYAYWSFFMSFFVLVSCGTWRILQKKKNLHKDKLKIFSSKLALTSQSRSFVSHQRLFYINLLSWHLAGAPQSLLWCQFFFRCPSVSIVLWNHCSAKINISWASSTTFFKPPLVWTPDNFRFWFSAQSDNTAFDRILLIICFSWDEYLLL